MCTIEIHNNKHQERCELACHVKINHMARFTKTGLPWQRDRQRQNKGTVLTIMYIHVDKQLNKDVSTLDLKKITSTVLEMSSGLPLAMVDHEKCNAVWWVVGYHVGL